MTLLIRIASRAAALVGLMLITACASASQPAGTPGHAAADSASPRAAGGATASPGASASPALDGCFTTARGAVESIPDPGGGTLTLAVIGSGPRTVILSNESDENLCSWLPLSARLAASGYRVVLWDYGMELPVNELEYLVKRLRFSGATRLALMGASEGAKVSLIAAARVTPPVRGVVSLSGESVLRPAFMVADSVRDLHCPLLFITADQDPYGSASAAREFMAAAPGRAKRLVSVPGTDHGTALLFGKSGATTLSAIFAFLHHVLT